MELLLEINNNKWRVVNDTDNNSILRAVEEEWPIAFIRIKSDMMIKFGDGIPQIHPTIRIMITFQNQKEMELGWLIGDQIELPTVNNLINDINVGKFIQSVTVSRFI